MNRRDAVKVLQEGKVYIECGPVSMVVAAWQNKRPLTNLCQESIVIVEETLGEISEQLPLLRQPWPKIEPVAKILSPLGKRMWQAVRKTGYSELTLMAAVAGCVADCVAKWLVLNGATKALVNNGGDIAIILKDGETCRIGIAPSLGAKKYSCIVPFSYDCNIGGIATSGLGGRSFTCGIADAVTVLAPSATTADAFATFLANESYVEAPQIERVLAGTLDPGSDIAHLMVTVKVGAISPETIKKSLAQVYLCAKEAVERGDIIGVMAHVQNESLTYPPKCFIKV